MATSSTVFTRRMRVGAEPIAGVGVHFRVWAPNCRRVTVCLTGDEQDGAAEHEAFEREIRLKPEADGFFSRLVSPVAVGARYWYRLDDDERLYPDPASRFQPAGPHGPSQVVDPSTYRWTDGAWRGLRLRGQILYEMHVGTFTQEGAWRSAARKLPELARLGITVIEVMPVADFPGRFGWSYDGVNLYAPTRLYGTPDDFRSFVNRAHELGIGVILDVVYNHLGPDGNCLKAFATDYFSDKYTTDWGEAINFDGPNADPVRDFFASNAAYWISEFHVDGLRVDATQDIHDASEDHILAEIARRTRAAAGNRSILLIAENEPQNCRIVRPLEDGGFGFDGLWNDDFHHSAMVQLSGRNEAYYSDYLGKPQEFISAIKRGYLFQGQWHSWQKQRRGTPTNDVPPAAFVTYIQNHDQIANSALGRRCHAYASPGGYKAMTALLLLGPGTPMLFQGQEFAASTPFFYFADHRPDLAQMVEQGRKQFMAQFPSMARPEVQAQLANPADPETFRRCKLRWHERHEHAGIYALHEDLLRLRRDDPVFACQRAGCVDGAVLGDEALVLRFFGESGQDRLLIVNFASTLHLNPAPEPLLAPPVGMSWHLQLSTEDVRYGGEGTPPPEDEDNWHIPGQAALVLVPRSQPNPDGERS